MTILYHIKFATYYRLDIMFSRFGNKLKHAKHITMVGNGERLHTVGGSLFIKFGYIGRPV